MSIVCKTAPQHVEEAQANLVEQFKAKERIDALLASWVEQVQDIEDSLCSILELSTLDTAIGETLDGFGAIVGEERKGRADDDYRLAISSRISLNVMEGTPEQIVQFIRGLVHGDKTVEIIEDFPAGFLIRIATKISVVGIDVALLLQDAKPAGVRAQLWWFESDIPFGFYDDPEAYGFDTGEFATAI